MNECVVQDEITLPPPGQSGPPSMSGSPSSVNNYPERYLSRQTINTK